MPDKTNETPPTLETAAADGTIELTLDGATWELEEAKAGDSGDGAARHSRDLPRHGDADHTPDVLRNSARGHPAGDRPQWAATFRAWGAATSRFWTHTTTSA